MSAGAVLATSVMVPFICLGMLLWLAWLEDTLADDVQKDSRRSAPKPIVAVPAEAPAPAAPNAVADQAEQPGDEPRLAVAS